MILHLILRLLKKEVNTQLRCKPRSKTSNHAEVHDVLSTCNRSMQSIQILSWTKQRPTQPWIHRLTIPISKCNITRIKSRPKVVKFDLTAEQGKQVKAWIHLQIWQLKFRCNNHLSRSKEQWWRRIWRTVKTTDRTEWSDKKLTCREKLTNPCVHKVFSPL